mmetsp:Transcript_85186/g.189354  ORF Transcript_85186/g.189354 Transcript_85186/m.189354 type:complete len:677 (+) Transcript_85186:76-2106(+)|eukprot:CAMPEP_0180578816 /NCGR_PEP_ID=MMETSP1037_2-20121125/12662_1 /TAXON_ID=632150 /ORGANISM="Azadinium spinosum, Strain 3D9" /LENGTH=676 /DNA_ID=CAMNT_0022596641 /DNA_START=56 /DNA_END=2086 /DNA_ORIENTATION=+
MADLVRTVDEDGEAEESADEDGPILSKRSGLGFGDLLSDEEEDEGAGWNFNSHEADDTSGPPAASTGLEERIRARLEEKRAEEEGGEEESAGPKATGAADGQGQSSKAKAKKRKGAVAPAEGRAVDMSHLQTNMQFADLRLSRPLLRAVADLGFDSPTPIQRDVVPPALRGLDVLATAETGSGKTASFLLPLLERLCQSPNVRARRRDANGRIVFGHVATKAMVLIPTRELALQCHAMLKDLARHTMVTFQLVAGGYVSTDQASSLRNQPDLVIATPGRLLDHLLNSHSVHMELLEIVVFDEADRLLELGFRDECLQVLKCCSKGKQTMLFSATLNTSVEDLASLALIKPVRIHSSPVNRVAETLEQEFVKAPSEELREAVLLSLVFRNYTKRVIIFCATKQAAHRVAIIFGLLGLSFAEIHGNLPQAERVKGLQQFQSGDANFLLATDLAARGLDLANVETVINFHLPHDVARYIHRCGRTARMGRVGRAVTIYCPEEYAKVKKLGKQCCTKVKSKVLKRTVAADAVQQFADKVDACKEDISSILQDESLDRELRLADILASKSENLQKHKEAIHSRPARTWYMTNGEKRKLKEAEAEKINAPEAPEPEEPSWKKRRKGEGELDEQEKAAAKRAKRNREKFLKKKDEEKAQRRMDEVKQRASARRARKIAKPGKM